MTLNKEQKIDRIYEVIADKTLSFGCKVFMWDPNVPYEYVVKNQWPVFGLFLNRYNKYNWVPSWIVKVIWHPVMIWDVLDWLQKSTPEDATIHNPNTLKLYSKPEMEKWYKHHEWDMYVPENNITIMAMWLFDALSNHITRERADKRKPIEDQSDECIDFIYSIIEKHE